VDVVIRELDHETLVDLIPLYRQVFQKEIDRAFLEAKYDTRYLGTPFFGHLAYDPDGRPVAFHGAVPVRLEVDGRSFIGAQYGDAMTLPEAAGQGLFTRLGRLTEEHLLDFGVRFSYAFLNQNSEYGYLNKLDWRCVHRIRCYSIPVTTLPLEKLSRAVSAGRAYQKWIRNRLGPSLRPELDLPNSAAGGGVIHTRRDRDFHTYKSFTNNFVIEVAGVGMWIKPEGGLLIGDMERRPEAEILAALAELKRIARSHGITRITFQASPGTHIETVFARHFDGFDSWVLGGKSLDPSLPIEDLRCTYGDLDTF
jgi:GNAT superfamily N-acetyltransferase